MAFILLLLFSALAVSSVAGYFSVMGLVSIFPAAAIAVGIMGASLELAKLTTASWIYRYWKTSNLLLKTYFMIAVLILSIVTSIGIFGYLSKAHLETTVNAGVSTEQILFIDQQIETEKQKINDSNTVLSQLDNTVKILIEAQRIRGANGSIALRNSQKVEREQLTKDIGAANARVSQLTIDKSKQTQEQRKVESELGPIKYVAELFYGKGDVETVDKAVRLLIILIILVFDPLAILLVVAANISIIERNQQLTPEKKDLTNDEKSANIVKESEEPLTDNFFSYPEPEVQVVTEIEEVSELDDSGSVHGVGPLVEEKAKKHAEDQVMIRKSNIRRL